MANEMYNSQTLYLRPIANIPEYRIRGCCRWLLAHYPYQFRNETDARLYLLGIWQTNPSLYRSILRRYFEASDYHVDTMPKRDCNRYFSTYGNSYGEDVHMYWHGQYN